MRWQHRAIASLIAKRQRQKRRQQQGGTVFSYYTFITETILLPDKGHGIKKSKQYPYDVMLQDF